MPIVEEIIKWLYKCSDELKEGVAVFDKEAMLPQGIGEEQALTKDAQRQLEGALENMLDGEAERLTYCLGR